MAGLRVEQLHNKVNQFMSLLSHNKIISLAKWKHERDVENQVLDWLILPANVRLKQHINSALLCTRTILQGLHYNTIHITWAFVWREPANCITLISQAVFIQVITMCRTVVKKSICHLNSNDFSIFPFGGINLLWAQTPTWLKADWGNYSLNTEHIPQVNTVYNIFWCFFF